MLSIHYRIQWGHSVLSEWLVQGTIRTIANDMSMELLKHDMSAETFHADMFEEKLLANAERPETEWITFYENGPWKVEARTAPFIDRPVWPICIDRMVKTKITPRVLSIRVPEDQAQAVWGLTREVWDLPPFALLNEALRSGDLEDSLLWQRGNADPLLEYFGPIFEPTYDGGQMTAITVITENSGRRLTLDETGKLRIDFPKGSLVAAGELIARIKELHDERREKTLMNGDSYVSEIDVYTENGTWFDVFEYVGPVHRDLGRARWDEEWREENPELAEKIPWDG